MSDGPSAMEAEKVADPGLKTGFSFGFSKNLASKPKFVPKAAAEEEVKDYIKDIRDGKIAGSKPVEEKVELVIPCSGNRIKFQAKSSSKSATGSGVVLEEDEAAKELLAEAQQWQESRDLGDTNGLDPNFVVPLRADPDDKEFLDADVATRAEVSSIDDYDKVPVEGFGMGRKIVFQSCLNQ